MSLIGEAEEAGLTGGTDGAGLRGSGRKCAVVTEPVSTIYEGPFAEKESEGRKVSAIADEGLCGMLLEVTGEAADGYLPVRTFYGYTGFIPVRDVRLLSPAEGRAWEASDLWVTEALCLDVLSVPAVEGVRLLSLFRGSLVEVLSHESEGAGWAKVRLADGREGYARDQYLGEKKFSQEGVFEGGIVQRKAAEEESFRRDLVETAKAYLGVQYRWGGRSTSGIDCSGLTSESYMLNGILTYRDARIVEGYPVREIKREDMKPGDLLYFPGHIAMYVGEGRYIHSTGMAGNSGVVYNSLRPEAADYRQDLAEGLYAVGSIF